MTQVPANPRLRWADALPAWLSPMPRPVDGVPLFGMFSARYALFQGARSLGLGASDTVLIPAYHCAAAVEPFLRIGARVQFYNVRRDCSLDLDDLEARIDGTTRALLVIHYFGFPQPMAAIQAFCRRHRLFLIEDCAHVLRGRTPDGPLGSLGDVSAFSWRKFFPLQDGGHLVLNRPGLRGAAVRSPGLLIDLKMVANAAEELLRACGGGALKRSVGALRGLAAVGKRALAVSGDRPTALGLDANDSAFVPGLTAAGMSLWARHILKRVDLAGVIASRRQNAGFLLDALGPLRALRPLCAELPEGVCPLALPFVAHGTGGVHVALRAQGVPATTWGGVIHPSLPLDEFPDAGFLFDNLVLLPIHQSLEDADLQAIVRVVRATVEGPR